MNSIHYAKFMKFLSPFDIEGLSITHRFKIRNAGKISATNFLISFFCLIQAKCYSQRQWAIRLSSISNKSISFQAIAKRLNSRSLRFVKALIAAAILKNVARKSCINQLNGLAKFNRVLVEDSTCIKLPPSLFPSLPGSANSTGKNVAVGKIQLCVDLKNGDYLNYGLSSYRQNDGLFASNILSILQPRDLVIRDLGYSANLIFNEIDKKEAYYIARLKIKSKVYTLDNAQLIDLAEVLKNVENNGQSYFESQFIIGGTNKLNCRVICLKLTPEQIENRKIQLRKNGNRSRKPSARTDYLQTWNLLITNIPVEQCCGQEIYQLYSLRWHIELIFKSWKSYINLDQIFKSCNGPNKIKPELLLCLCLCYIVLVINPQFKQYQKLIHKTFNKFLSPMKFMKAVLNNLIGMAENVSPVELEIIHKNCCYDVRKDRINIYEKIIYL